MESSSTLSLEARFREKFLSDEAAIKFTPSTDSLEHVLARIKALRNEAKEFIKDNLDEVIAGSTLDETMHMMSTEQGEREDDARIAQTLEMYYQKIDLEDGGPKSYSNKEIIISACFPTGAEKGVTACEAIKPQRWPGAVDEIKTTYYEKSGVKIAYFSLAGDKLKTGTIIRNPKYLVPFTVNPATIMGNDPEGNSFVSEVIVSENLRNAAGYLSNNLGSRLLSVNVDAQHHIKMLDENIPANIRPKNESEKSKNSVEREKEKRKKRWAKKEENVESNKEEDQVSTTSSSNSDLETPNNAVQSHISGQLKKIGLDNSNSQHG
ncbi:MAG: hypothetical protein V4694_04860 [Pseudomonadota bacterium]